MTSTVIGDSHCYLAVFGTVFSCQVKSPIQGWEWQYMFLDESCNKFVEKETKSKTLGNNAHMQDKKHLRNWDFSF